MLIWITTQFEAFHCWPDAPSQYAFLASLHRHTFHVKMWWDVTHDNRDIEFIDAKRRVAMHLSKKTQEKDTETWSCEHWARHLLNQFNAQRVSVSEDNENGADVTRL